MKEIKTKRERVISAVAHKHTEPAPYHIDLTVPLADKICAYLKIQKDELFDWFGNHIEEASYRKGQWLENEVYQDPFGVQWDRSGADKDIGIIKEYI